MTARNAPSPLTRRRYHALLAGAALAASLPALTACAASPPWGAARAYTLSEARLNELLARRFPYTRDFAGLAELTLSAPRVHLLPQANRLGTQLDIALRERIGRAQATGAMELDYALRFDAREGAVRMLDAHVRRLDIGQLPPAERLLVAQYAPRLAERLLADMVLYRLPAEQLTLARSLGLTVGALRVLPEGLRIELVPEAPAR